MFDKYQVPFIKNNYYEGKLLKAEDFTLEQKYMQDKRKLSNKFLRGIGVVDGLEAIIKDNETVTILPGMCIDSQGNDIVVSEPYEVKIKEIPGYVSKYHSRNLYLVIEYKEEPIYEEIDESPDKLKETFNLRLTEELYTNEYGKEIRKIYDREGIIIYNELATQAYSSSVIKGRLIIENPSMKKVTTLIKSDLERLLTMDHKNKVTIEGYIEKDTVYEEFPYKLRVIGNSNEEAKVTFETAEIHIDEKESELNDSSPYQINIKENVDKNIYNDKAIYLARITLDSNGQIEKINSIKNLPFGQSITCLQEKKDAKSLETNTHVIDLMPSEKPRADVKYLKEKNKMIFTFGLPKPQNENHNKISTGTVVIDLGNGGKANRCYYSNYIHHKLGEGPVGIILAAEEKMVQLSGLPEPEEQLIFGDFEVFSESDCISQVPPHTLGAVLYPKESRFKIGIKLKESTKLKQITIRWWAYKNTNEVVEDEVENDNEEIKISIKPDKLDLKKGQKIQLKASVENTTNQNVTWRILDRDGGKITQKGFYTAPAMRGVFKIEATSVADFSKSATVIVVVKD